MQSNSLCVFFYELNNLEPGQFTDPKGYWVHVIANFLDLFIYFDKVLFGTD